MKLKSSDLTFRRTMEITVYVSHLTFKHLRHFSNTMYLWAMNCFRINP